MEGESVWVTMERWKTLMEGDQIPISINSMSLFLLLVVAGLVANLTLVLFIIKSIIFFTVKKKQKKGNGSGMSSLKESNEKRAFASGDLYSLNIANRKDGKSDIIAYL